MKVFSFSFFAYLRIYSYDLALVYYLVALSGGILITHDGMIVFVYSLLFIAEGWSSFSERHVEDVCSANIQRFRSRRRTNKSSLAQLLVSFFHKVLIFRFIASYHIAQHIVIRLHKFH